MPSFASFRACGRFRCLIAPPLLLAALLLSAATPAFPQEEEDLTAGLTDLDLHLKKGRQFFSELKFQDAIVELTRVVEIYEGGKAPDLGEKEIPLVAEALDLRARAYFNQGDRARAKLDFAKLLRVKIDYQIDRSMVSPKVTDLFDQVRKETVGILAITTDPPGAEAWLSDEPLPRTPIVGHPAFEGTYKLRLKLKGYQDHEEDLSVAPHAEAKREIRLVPNLRNLQFITQPPGVNVIVDGELVGTTFGTLSPDLYPVVRDTGLDPGKASAPLLVKYVAPGNHEVRFEKECYESNPRSVAVTLDLDRNAPQVFQPILMKEDLGEIKITSHPSGADVLVDGRAQGTTPIHLGGICAGERDVRLVKKGGGTWFERVRVKPDAVNLLDARLRPTLLYLGTFHLDEWGRLSWSDEDKALLEGLSGLRSVNQVRPDDNLRTFRSALLQEMAKPEIAEQLRHGAGLPASRVLDALNRFQADLVLAVLSLRDEPGRGVPTAFLYSSEQPEPDTRRVDLSSTEAVKGFLARFDQFPDLARPWMGATFADTLLGGGPVVVRVVKGGPAASAGLLVGDQIVSVNGRGVESVQSITAASNAWNEKDKVTLAVRRDGSLESVTASVGRTPVLIPMNSPAQIYNKLLCDYRQLSRSADDPRDRALALLNLGISFMHFRSYDKALSEGLNISNLPAGSGISRGTVRYYQGLCYLRKDLIPEARTAFQDAVASAEATLESNDGTPVANRARKLLQ